MLYRFLARFFPGLSNHLGDAPHIVKLREWWKVGTAEGNPVRCYFIKEGHITAVKFLTASDDQAQLDEARKLFAATGRELSADGIEVWDEGRFVARFPDRPAIE